MIKTLNNAYCRAYSLAPPLLYDKKMIISCVALSIICVVGAALAATYLPLLGACFVASFLLSAAAYASISALVGIIFAAIGRPQHRVNSKQMGQSSDSSSPKEPKSSTSHDVSKANVAVVRNGQHKLSKDIEELKTKMQEGWLKLYSLSDQLKNLNKDYIEYYKDWLSFYMHRCFNYEPLIISIITEDIVEIQKTKAPTNDKIVLADTSWDRAVLSCTQEMIIAIIKESLMNHPSNYSQFYHKQKLQDTLSNELLLAESTHEGFNTKHKFSSIIENIHEVILESAKKKPNKDLFLIVDQLFPNKNRSSLEQYTTDQIKAAYIKLYERTSFK